MLKESFLTYLRCELKLSDHTVSSYGCDIGQWYDFAARAELLGCGREKTEPDPVAVTVNHLRQWVAYMANEQISQRSIRRKIQSLRAFYKYLMRRHGVEVNPAAELMTARLPHRLPNYIKPEQTNALLDADYNQDDFDSVRNHLIVDMFYSTGMRCSELLTLKDEDINYTRSELKVLGKRNKERIIPFGDEMSTLIKQYRELRDRTMGSIAGGEFFRRADGRPLYRRMVYKIVHDALQGNVTASKLSPHVLRHSFASDMLNSGADITSVQQLLGHQSLATTQIYTHLSYRELLTNYQLAHPRAQKHG